MRAVKRALIVAGISSAVAVIGCLPLWVRASEKSVAIYDPNPAHLWNRLHAAIFVRSDIPSTALVPDALDPPLWLNTSYLLSRPSHEQVLHVLDEFLQNHGERLIRDPLKRAMLQRDLWSVFDWSVDREAERPGEPSYDREREELQTRLVEIMRRIALTPEEIRALPANYEQAVASGQFGKEYDPAHPDRPFLPPDLFAADGPWVQVYGSGLNSDPIAVGHSRAFPRSTFSIFMRFPQGRKPVFDYLQTLWDLPQPWIASPNDPRHEQTALNPVLPQFPAGTEVALVRQALLINREGNMESVPITESVQIRVYRTVTSIDRTPGETASTLTEASKNSGQDFYQIRLSRPQFFAVRAGGLRATESSEKEFMMFDAFGADEGVRGRYMSLDQYQPVLLTCFMCHRGAGINSLNSRERLVKPNWLQHDSDPGTPAPAQSWSYEAPEWSRNRYDWGLLSGYWKSGASR